MIQLSEKKSCARLLVLTFLLIMAAWLTPVMPEKSWAAETVAYPVTGGNLYFDKSTGAITWADKDVTAAVIPDKIGKTPVTGIGDRAFSGCTNLKSVTIPGSVKNIGARTFMLHKNLTSVTVKEGVTSIGDNTFGACDSLTSLTIPGSVRSIGDNAFSGCRSLKSVTIKKGVKTIGDNAFGFCDSLTSLTIPGSVKSIGEYAFWDCRSLTDITIKSTILTENSVKDSAFTWIPAKAAVKVPKKKVKAYKKLFQEKGLNKTVKIKALKVPKAKKSKSDKQKKR